MKNFVSIPLPFKGVSRFGSRSDQPANTAWDALNVLPFDRTRRRRIGQRSGVVETDKLNPDGDFKVRLLHQATVATSAVTFNQRFVEEQNSQNDYPSFNFAAGTGDIVDRLIEVQGDFDSELTVRHGPAGSFVLDGTSAFNSGYGTVSAGGLLATAGDSIAQGISLVTTSDVIDDAAALFAEQKGFTVEFSFRYTQLPSTSPFPAVAFGYTEADVASNDNNGNLGPIIDDVAESVKMVFAVNYDGTYIYPDAVALGPIIPTAVWATNALPTFEVNATYKVQITVYDGRVYTFQSKNGGPMLPVAIYDFNNAGEDATVLEGCVAVGIDVNSTDFNTIALNNFRMFRSIAAQPSRTISKVVATAGTKTYYGEPFYMAEVENTGDYAIDADARIVQAATILGYTYIADGTNVHKLNLISGKFEPYSASAGSIPVGCQLAAAYRGRLILSGLDSDPQNFFASKVGDPTNWDYSPATRTSDQAFAGNAAQFGRVGQPILALATLSDDVMLIFGDSTVWAMRGDPAAGGSIDLLSDSCGIAHANAFTKTPDGGLVWVWRDGLYKVDQAGRTIKNLTETSFPQFFQGIDRGLQNVSLLWDNQNGGCWVFVTDETSGENYNLFYDGAVGGVWPQKFPANVGPYSALFFDGFGQNDQVPLLGGRDSSIFGLNPLAKNDAESTIEAFVEVGAVRFNGTNDALVSGLVIDQGELFGADTASNWNLDVTIYGSKTAYDVTEGRANASALSQATTTFTAPGRTPARLFRVRGGWHVVRLANDTKDTYFSVEDLQVSGVHRGQLRRRV